MLPILLFHAVISLVIDNIVKQINKHLTGVYGSEVTESVFVITLSVILSSVGKTKSYIVSYTNRQ